MKPAGMGEEGPADGQIPSRRVAILWGGGLGDVLVMRPMLEALIRRGDEPVYLTRSDRCTPVFAALALPIQRRTLPRPALAAFRALRAAGFFDWVYTGPGSGWRTRLLARMLRSGRSRSQGGRARSGFVADAIAEDVVALGLADRHPPPYGSRPIFPEIREAPSRPPEEPYLVLHPGSRSDWQTKCWPMVRWQALLETLSACGWRMLVVGTAEERETLAPLMTGRSRAERVSLHTDWPLARLERYIAGAAGVICHNSGVMHLALAYRRPTVVLTGSSARHWRAAYPEVFNLDSGRCRLACNRRRCPVPGFRARCIRSLEIGPVVDACLALWAGGL